MDICNKKKTEFLRDFLPIWTLFLHTDSAEKLRKIEKH